MPVVEPSSDLKIVRAETPGNVAAVKTLFQDYLRFVENFLDESLAFQDTAGEFARFPDSYDALFLARLGGAPVGAAGLKRFDARRGELKRLFVREAARGRGLGERLIAATVGAARARGYAALLLDTDPGLVHANRIYERMGFRYTACYYPNPRQDRSRYMVLEF